MNSLSGFFGGFLRPISHSALAVLLACCALVSAQEVEPAAPIADPAVTESVSSDTVATESESASDSESDSASGAEAANTELEAANSVAEPKASADASSEATVEASPEAPSIVATESPPAPTPVACDAASPACLTSCKRFRVGDARLQACENFCRTRASDRMACSANADVSSATAAVTALPSIDPLPKRADMLRALEKNGKMLIAIRAGNLKTIRRFVEVEGLHPTYVYAYDYNAQTRQYDGRVGKLRLRDIFEDANTLRSNDEGLDRILMLFMELGMDVTAKLPDATSTGGRTAWGPNLKMMETARDRDARMRAFELALQKGLVPNDDFSEWLFAELPQICGRDKSKFAIEVTELLIRYLGALVKDNLWRSGARGPETVADVLDLSFAPPQAKYEYQKKQFAQQDMEWENCALLSRRINRFLTVGN